MLAFLFYLLRLRRYKTNRVKSRCLQEWVGHLEPFQGEGVAAGEYFLVSTKLDILCCPTVQTAPCYVRRFDTIPACDGQTDGRTDGRTELP